MRSKDGDPAAYLQRLRPLYVELFRMAHAIVGNVELSEYVLRSAIVEAYLRRREWQGRMGFQDGLEHTVRSVALVELRRIRAAGSFELDWALPPCPTPEHPVAQNLWSRFLRESETTQRIALLYYGCGLTNRQIAQVMRMGISEVSGRLRRLCSRLSRGAHLSGQRGRRALESYLEKLMLTALSQPGEEVPEAGAVFRSFERDVDGATRPRLTAGRVLATVIKVVGAVLLAAAFWLLAVLLEPSLSGVLPADTQGTQSQAQLESPAPAGEENSTSSTQNATKITAHS